MGLRAIRRAAAATLIAISALAAGMPDAALAAPQPPLVITNDHGGRLNTYLAQLEQLRTTGQRVEIRGKCQSSCTVLLGAPGACVTPSARLGFHGPRYLDRQIPPERFDHWSTVMADTYPPAIARWYLQDARYRIDGVKVVTGQNLIRLGIPRC